MVLNTPLHIKAIHCPTTKAQGVPKPRIELGVYFRLRYSAVWGALALTNHIYASMLGGNELEPITMIITALVAGVASAAKDTAGTAVQDAYEGLKALLKAKFKGNAAAEAALEEHAKDSETWDKPLRKSLRDARADQDADLMAAAQSLLKLVDPEGITRGKYNSQVSGNVQGIVQGDHSQVTMQFGTTPDSHKE